MALAHRRLSILDLSAAGAQPMQLGAHVLTYNGELYNFHTLRASLRGPLRSNCDTEVLLQLLVRDGKRCLSELVDLEQQAIFDPHSLTRRRAHRAFCAAARASALRGRR